MFNIAQKKRIALSIIKVYLAAIWCAKLFTLLNFISCEWLMNLFGLIFGV